MCSTFNTPGLFHHYSSIGHSHVCARADCCLQHTKFTPGGADPGTSARGRGRCMSRWMEVLGEGWEVWPPYMEVGAGGGGGENIFQLKGE